MGVSCNAGRRLGAGWRGQAACTPGLCRAAVVVERPSRIGCMCPLAEVRRCGAEWGEVAERHVWECDVLVLLRAPVRFGALAATCPRASPLHDTHEAGDLVGVDVLRCRAEREVCGRLAGMRCVTHGEHVSMPACHSENASAQEDVSDVWTCLTTGGRG